MLKKKKNQKGFTLVELLVVIAIIGILAVIAVPALFKNIDSAKVSATIGDVQAIRTAVMGEYVDNNITTDTTVNKLPGLENLSEDTYKLTCATTPTTTATLIVTTESNDIAKKVTAQWGKTAEVLQDGLKVKIDLLDD